MSRALVALVTVVVASCAIAPIETYTLLPGGLVTAVPNETAPLTYTVEGQSGDVVVDEFVPGGGAAQVGDVLLAVDGHPSMAFTARPRASDCWVIEGEARLDGRFVDVRTLGDNLRSGTEFHVRVPTAPVFQATTDGSRLVGTSLCVDRHGLAISYH